MDAKASTPQDGARKRAQKGPERRVGLTPSRVVDEAIALTRGRGFHTWTVRDLAAALDVAPSVIYHHMGSKQEIIRQAIERISATHPAPPRGLEWQEFFRTFLLGLHAPLLEYPGTAKWLVMHGPSFPAVRQIFDSGMEALRRAGFPRPAMVYALLVNSAVLTVVMRDERLESGEDGPRDHAAMQREFEAHRHDSSGIADMIDEMIAPLSSDPEGAGQAVTDEYYRLLVESLILGLEQQLH